MKKRLKYFLIPLPFIIGFWGFLIGGNSAANSAFYAFLLYFTGYSSPVPNIWAEIARWSAPICTGGILIQLFRCSTFARNCFRNLFRNTTCIYGDDSYAAQLRDDLGNKLITPSGDTFVHAKSYILAWDDEKNFQFYARNFEKLRKRKTAIRCTSIQPQDINDPALIPFCPEETAARVFWISKAKSLYSLSKEGKPVTISIIGFDRLGQELLLTALLNNIFAADQCFTYHVFGDSKEFAVLYPGIDKIEDKVLFHDNWFEAKEVLSNSDMILVSEPENQLALISKLCFALNFSPNDKRIHAFRDNSETSNLPLNDHIQYYNRSTGKPCSKNEPVGHSILCKEIFQESTLHDAKELNLEYVQKHAPVGHGNADEEWKKLDSFTRYSNIRSADYMNFRRVMLKNNTNPDTQTLNMLSELEHIRWCRYHYLSGWTYGVPENGSRKDRDKRIHKDLVPYDCLSDEEKRKDTDNILVMLNSKIS